MPSIRNIMQRFGLFSLCIQRSNINHYDTPEFFQRNWTEFRSQLHFARTSICTLVVVQIPESLRKSDVMSTCVLTLLLLATVHPRFPRFPFLSRPRSDWSLFRCESNADSGYQCRASLNEIIIIKRRSCSRVGYRATVALPSNRGIRGSHGKVKWIIASNVENHLPISHSSIFHRAFLLSTFLSPSLRSPPSAIVTINYTVYFGIKRASSICDAWVCDLGL